MKRRTLFAWPVVALVVAGCGVPDPYADRPIGDRRGSEQPARRVDQGDPEAILRRVAAARGNWTATTIKDSFKAAITLTVGPARSELVRQETELETAVRSAPAGLRARAFVEAVSFKGSGDRRTAIVVTRESITGEDIPGEGFQYKVTLATVDRNQAGWLVSEWEPQP